MSTLQGARVGYKGYKGNGAGVRTCLILADSRQGAERVVVEWDDNFETSVIDIDDLIFEDKPFPAAKFPETI